MNYTDLATTVTQQLVAQIETGPGTWRMPWHTVPGVFGVRNASTGNRYRGANTVSLALQAIEAEHPTGWWSTYRQWSDLDAQIRKGERSTRIVKWVPAKRNDTDAAPANQGSDEEQRTLVPRSYSVYNAAQVDGWTLPTPTAATEIERNATADAFDTNTGALVAYSRYHADSQYCARVGESGSTEDTIVANNSMERLFEGRLGIFLPLKSSTVPDLEGLKFSEGQVERRDGLVSVRLLSDKLLGEPSVNDLPNAILAATEEGGAILLQVHNATASWSIGGGKISTDSYLCRALVVDNRLPHEVCSTRVYGAQVGFEGSWLTKWAGLSTIHESATRLKDGSVTSIDVSVRLGEERRAALPKGQQLILQASASTDRGSGAGLDLREVLSCRITSGRPTDVDQPLRYLHRVQDLLSVAFDGFQPASTGRVSLDWQGPRKHDASLWQSSLMPQPESLVVTLANHARAPLFLLKDLGGVDGVARWIRLYDTYPRAVSPIVNAVRRPPASPEVQVLEMNAAIDYWVNSHKGRAWRKRGAHQPEALALHLGRCFADWVGNTERWSAEFRDFANALKHDPAFAPDRTVAMCLSRSARLLLTATLLSRAANNKEPARSLFDHPSNRSLGDWLQARYA